MEYKVIEKKVLSCNGKNLLAGVVYLPQGEVRGYVHVVHGMTDHISRYEELFGALASLGYITFGYDHLGHGYTARDDSELGFIASSGGHELLIRDVKTFSDSVIEEYGAHPYYLLGHSMGSFIVRLAVQKYVTPEKLIVMGTGGPNPVAGVGLLLCDIIRIFKGERYISTMIENTAFSTYNSHFTPKEGQYAWLTRIEENRAKYAADRFCTFKFTVSAMHDLITLNKSCNASGWYRAMGQKKVPTLLVSGDSDPVGDYGKGVSTVYERLTKAGVPTTLKLYPDARHEILNDLCADEVIADIVEFLK